jgi:dynactin-5
MADCLLRGDLTRPKAPNPSDPNAKTTSTAISIGKATVIATGTVIRPPCRMSRGAWTPYPVKIGDQVFIGPYCVIQAALIHSHVHIGEKCILQPFCIVRENVKVLPGTVVPANMVIPPGSIVAGRPARIVGEVGEGWGVNGVGEEWVEGGDLREVVRSIK